MTRRVTQAEFARLCGVNRSTVNRWIKNARIEVDAHGLIDPEAAQKMRDLTESPLPHHQARKAQFDEARQGAGQGGAEKTQPAPAQSMEALPAAEKIGLRLKFATMKEREARAAMAAMEQDKMAGLLVERAEVDYVLADFGNTLRGLLEGLPDRLAPSIAAHRGDVSAIHRDLEDTALTLLTEISEHMKRKMEAMAQ